MRIELIDVILVAAMLVAGVWTVLAGKLLRSVIGLAVVSLLLTVIMYRLNSPLSAVFELSVCAGLVSAIFLSVIGLTVQQTPEQETARSKERLRRFWLLPVLMIVVGLILSQLHLPVNIVLQGGPEKDVREILWTSRHLDLLGQIIVLLGGALGVVVLFKEWNRAK